jgi:NADPH:quinone reductase-like Zn-dependent oxidoreductase
MFSTGQVRPVVDRIFSPEEAGEAHEVMQSNANFGKLLISWN